MLTLCCLAVEAIPAYPSKRTAVRSDGTQVTLTFRGDEHISFYTDEAGRAYQINAKGIAEPIDIQEVSRVWSERMAKANLRRAERAERRNMAVTRAVGEPNSTLTGSKKGLVILMEGIKTLCLHTQFTQGPIGLCAAAVGYQNVLFHLADFLYFIYRSRI